jgi:hypothetical protein
MTKTAFHLGDRLRDTISGVEGTAISYYFHLNGCQYIECEVDPKDGVRSTDNLYLPEERYELVRGNATKKTPNIAGSHVKLGYKVRDMLTGFDGHAIIFQVPLFGVARIAVEPTTVKDGGIADAIFFDEQRVEVTEAKEAPVAKDMPEERKERGCAPARVPANIMGRTR